MSAWPLLVPSDTHSPETPEWEVGLRPGWLPLPPALLTRVVQGSKEEVADAETLWTQGKFCRARRGLRLWKDSSNKENAIEDEEEEEEEEDDEEDDLEVKEENGVLVLNDANFDNFVADKDTVLLEFYAPWCGHCKQFAPEYEKIANTLKDNDPPIPVAKIDATSASMLASRFDVSGYPTIKILKKGQAVDYEGSRTQEGELVPELMEEEHLPPGTERAGNGNLEIVAKVREVSQPDWTPPPEVTLVLTKENFDEVVNDADIILVEFYAPWCRVAGADSRPLPVRQEQQRSKLGVSFRPGLRCQVFWKKRGCKGAVGGVDVEGAAK
ncbi:Protein disulfide-isomerase A4 [Saguinus oedipus]|uniref:protein disulfide-isomerase n=1 Tax=Saguinus oedipus TaxID=9490 RepID=A0ABQ9UJ75_SAGOE|nr:Protein disulfide-isomerase A4 [Saguinus oedipus]